MKLKSPRLSGAASDAHFVVRYGADEIPVNSGKRLLDAILEAGFEHRHICGGRGFCTSCRVEVTSAANGLSPVSSLERERLGADAGRLRLACQCVVRGSVGVRVPPPAPSRFSPDGD